MESPRKYRRVSGYTRVPATSATSPIEWIPDVTSWAPKDSMQGSFSELVRDCHEISPLSPGDAGHWPLSDDDLSPRDRREVPEAPTTERKLGGVDGVRYRNLGKSAPPRPAAWKSAEFLSSPQHRATDTLKVRKLVESPSTKTLTGSVYALLQAPYLLQPS